ncbi:MAG: tetratricopeptide repeat protein [Candidatus Obscuribacterales bacterium]|nr:tetratricopeptide repeat protein [Candidatus Obscuribacterales bacterium]
MEKDPEIGKVNDDNWGPYQLGPNPLAILKLSLGTAAAISTALLIPDAFALLPSAPNLGVWALRAFGLWAYAYVLWASGFLGILHLIRIFGSPLLLDKEGIRVERIGKKLLWDSIIAIQVSERKIFSRLFFIPAYQMTLHIAKADGKKSVKQIASFQYLPKEFYSLFYFISKLSVGAEPRSVDAFIFRESYLGELKKISEEGRLKRLALTAVISFGLCTFLGRKAMVNYAFNMGNKEFRAAHYDKAIVHYSSASALDFSFAPAWDRLARSEFRQGEIDLAEEHWREALKWKPDFVEAKLGLSNICIQKGKIEEADALVRSANRLAPLDEAAYINRAQIDALMGKSGSAITLLENFVRQREGRELAIANLARLYLREGELSKAARLLKTNPSLLMNPFTRPYCRMVAAELKLAEKNADAAAELLNPMRLGAANHAELLIDFGRLASLQKNYSLAKKYFDASEKLNPDSPFLALARADMELASGARNADFYIAKARSYKYQDATVLAPCAELLLRQGDSKEALELAKTSLSLYPQNEIAKNVLLAVEGKSK